MKITSIFKIILCNVSILAACPSAFAQEIKLSPYDNVQLKTAPIVKISGSTDVAQIVGEDAVIGEINCRGDNNGTLLLRAAASLNNIEHGSRFSFNNQAVCLNSIRAISQNIDKRPVIVLSQFEPKIIKIESSSSSASKSSSLSASK